VAPQIAAFGAVFMAATLMVFGAIACFSGVFGTVLQRSVRAQWWLNRLAGVVFWAWPCAWPRCSAEPGLGGAWSVRQATAAECRAYTAAGTGMGSAAIAVVCGAAWAISRCSAAGAEG
jgi:hypothetical protein